jgi:hypothetical protein
LQGSQDIPRYVPIAADYCRGGAGIGEAGGAGGGGGSARAAFLASVTTRFLRDEAGRIREVGWWPTFHLFCLHLVYTWFTPD